MPKNRTEIVELALRELRILSTDENASSDQIGYVGDLADMAFAEFTTTHEAVAWTLADVPDAVARPFAMLVAADAAEHYGRPAPRRSRALGRILAAIRQDDREDRRDVDEDGTISEDEADAGLRALYY